MWKSVIAGLAILFASNATATIIQIDLEGAVAPGAGWLWNLPGPMPTTVTTSFWVNTLSADRASFAVGTYEGDRCVDSFDAEGLNGSNLRVSTDRGLLWSADSLELQFTGRNPSPHCGGFFGSLTASEDERSLYTFTDMISDIRGPDLFVGGDPLANILLSLYAVPSFQKLDGEWGFFTAMLESVSIHEVPEPGAFGLLAIGMLGLALGRKVRRRTLVVAAHPQSGLLGTELRPTMITAS